jgi:hypothetical protein
MAGNLNRKIQFLDWLSKKLNNTAKVTRVKKGWICGISGRVPASKGWWGTGTYEIFHIFSHFINMNFIQYYYYLNKGKKEFF